MGKSELPQIIKDVGFENGWNEKEVWELKFPTETVPIEVLTWHFDIPFWNSDNGWYDLTPRQVLENPSCFGNHVERIEQADTNYPIDICSNPKTKKWTILDGLHRLAKLSLHSIPTANVRKIPYDQVPWKKKIERLAT